MLGGIGVILGIAVLVLSAYKGITPLLCAAAAAAVVIVLNGMNFWAIFDGAFSTNLKNFVGSNLLLFVLGSVYGAVMEASGTAKTIAYTLLKICGKKHAVLAIILATSILNFGGVSVFVIIYAVYPFAIYILKETDISKRFLPAIVMFAAGTYTMVILPGNPSIMNLTASQYLGTNIYAAPIMGTAVSVFVFVAGYLYLIRAIKRDQARNRGFIPAEGEIVENLEDMDLSKLPPFYLAVIPLILVIVMIGLTQKMFSANNARNTAMFIAIAFMLVFNRKRLGTAAETLDVISKGITSSFTPILATASVVGFAGVVAAAPAFAGFMGFAAGMSARFSPYIAGAVSMNLLAGICGSSLGGTTIFFNQMAGTFLVSGVNLEAFHRIMGIASCGLASLPHSGIAITLFTVCKVTHKEAYGPVFITAVIITLIGLVIAIAMGSLGIV